MSNEKPFEAVLLDVDGTLIDSNDAHAHAWVDVGREFGFPIAFHDVRWLVGMGGDKVLPRLTGLQEASDAGRALLERRGEIFRADYLPRLHALPGAPELLARMRADGLTLVVATSASRQDLAALLRQAGLEDLVEEAANADDAEESKPSPDIIEAALAKAGARPERALMLGDTPYDIEAAARAGVQSIAFTSGGWSRQELAGASEVYDGPAALLAAYSESPLVR